jgi:hypothetical protein
MVSERAVFGNGWRGIGLRLRGRFAALPCSIYAPGVLALLSIIALVIWGASLGRIDLNRMNDLGLISVLPWQVFAALVLLSVCFFFSLALPQYSERLAAFQVILLILMLYGLTALIQEVPRFGASWKHVGVIDMILRTASVDPAIDAYNNWPGFFILGALITKAAGMVNAIPLLSWAPVFFNLLYLLPLRMLMLAATPGKRLAWLGIWFFYLANWVGQDYFSPQAFGYFLGLVILSILLTWFARPGAPAWLTALQRRPTFVSRLIARLEIWWERAEPLPNPSQPVQRMALLLVVILGFIVMVASHQLTPFSILAGVAVLVLFDRLTLRGLPLLMAILLGTWIAYMTVAYLSGHLGGMLSYFGAVSDTVGANLTDRLNGSPGHMIVTRLRLVVALYLWGLAFLGGVRRIWNRRLDLNHALLALAPFPLIALQNYGGELLMRIYLFALPFMAFFAAALFLPRFQAQPSWRTILSAGLASLVLMGLFLFVRYGNERSDYFTSDELAAVEFVYERAQPGMLIAASSTNLPIRYENYETVDYLFLEKLVLEGDVNGVIAAMEHQPHPASYLVLTRSQAAFLEMFYNKPEGDWQLFQQNLLASGRFQRLYTNPDASVYLLLPRQEGNRP